MISLVASLLALGLPPGSWAGDVVTLKSGEQLECLIIEVDDRQVKLRRGSEGVSEFRQLSRTDVTEILRGKVHPTEKPRRLYEILIEVHTEPGEYVLHLTTNDYSGDGGGGFGCCWTTALVKVSVK